MDSSWRIEVTGLEQVLVAGQGVIGQSRTSNSLEFSLQAVHGRLTLELQ
jgi:hypothetical protein